MDGPSSSSSSSSLFVQRASEAAQAAVYYDQQGRLKEALALYVQAIEFLEQAAAQERQPAQAKTLQTEMFKYLQRAEAIKKTLLMAAIPADSSSSPINSTTMTTTTTISSNQQIPSTAKPNHSNSNAKSNNNTEASSQVEAKFRALVHRIDAVSKRAEGEQRELRYFLAKQSFIEAADLCASGRDLFQENPGYVKILETKGLSAISYAERLKQILSQNSLSGPQKQQGEDEDKTPVLSFPQIPNTLGGLSSPKPSMPSSSSSSSSSSSNTPSPSKPPPQSHPTNNKAPNLTSGVGDKLTSKEIKVLETTSVINGRQYLPWFAADLKESFVGLTQFEDPDGLLPLSPKQRERLRAWVRPQDIYSEQDVKIIVSLSSYAIKQTVVSNCSFVSSLAIIADYEKRFGRQIITRSIYPQNKEGQPVVSPNGKYMVRLFFNGVWRKVVVDDRFPVSPSNELLCAYSNNRGEMWVSIMEKAYLKVMGGYDFPGSNSSIDLHALSGWVPERMSLKSATDEDFERLWKNFHTGKMVITVATGELSDADAERAGLVPTHAYALLDIRDMTKTHGVRLLRLKNPWSHRRWRGNYSPYDENNWTPQLMEALSFDRDASKEVDNGVFWIDWGALCRFFEVCYMNWDDSLFTHRAVIHDEWLQGSGPVKDLYNLEHNPQYSLEVSAQDEKEDVWVLLSRHITSIDDFANNKEYITLHVFAGGERVYYPDDALVMGTKINSPHYLLKLSPPSGAQRYTLVVSQFEKSTTLQFTVKVFSTCPVSLKALVSPYTFEKRIKGEWSESTAGGSPNDREAFARNPSFYVKGVEEGKMFVKLEAPRQYSAGLQLSLNDSKPLSSDVYRSGFCYLTLPLVPSGAVLRITPSTFLKGQLGPFFLTIASTAPFEMVAKAT